MEPAKVYPIVALLSFVTVGEAGRGSVGTRLTRSGALLIAVALVFLVVGIARA